MIVSSLPKVIWEGLLCALLAVLIVLGLQMTTYLAQLGEATARMENRAAALAEETRATLLYSQAVLASVRATTEEVRKSAVHQVGYTEAMLRRSATTAAKVELLVDHLDERTEALTQAAGKTLYEHGALANHAHASLDDLMNSGLYLLGGGIVTMQNLNDRIADERIDELLDAAASGAASLDRAAGNVAIGTESGAKAIKNVEQATDLGRRGPLYWLVKFLW